ncbi:histidine phosphatase family protein [Luteibacter sp.]|uniref:histidine phosphatase family protein n=1 Tax=Luteibacter sp. TaxID=1886636 RepID=UPI003F7DBC2F
MGPRAGKLYIVRHGQSAGNVLRDHAEAAGDDLIALHNRDADTPLSPLGYAQAQALGEWMAQLPDDERPDTILSSPFVRAHQTAAALAEALGIDESRIEIDERLREKEFGILDRYTRKGIETTYPELAAQRGLVGKFYFRPPGGESWCDVILRLRSVVDGIRLTRPDCRVVVVGHQVIVNCFRYLLEGMREAEILAIDRQGDFPNCGYAEYDVVKEPAVSFRLRKGRVVPPTVRDVAVTGDSDVPGGPR